MNTHSPQWKHFLSGRDQNSSLRFSASCPMCRMAYDFQHIRVIAEQDQSLLTHITCGNCGTGVITVLSMQPHGIIVMGMVTDLTPEEFHFLRGTDIREDDVLEFYAFLQSAEGAPQAFTLH